MGRQKTFGFGFMPEESKHHFLVVIPKDKNDYVCVYECFEWDEETSNQTPDQKQLKVYISKHKWQQIKDPLQKEFNKRLKEYKINIGRWGNGKVPVDRLLGKEMVLLMWAIEDSDPSIIPDAVKNWLGLTKEERWWLFTMTNASTGHAYDKRGWRKAVRFALTENPVDERAAQRNIIEELFKQHAEKQLKR